MDEIYIIVLLMILIYGAPFFLLPIGYFLAAKLLGSGIHWYGFLICEIIALLISVFWYWNWIGNFPE